MGSYGNSAAIPGSAFRTQLLTALFFTAMTAASAQIAFRLWFTPVPVTLQVLAVILSGLALGSRWGAISQLQYLAIGAMGLPVFAGFQGGPAVLAGPTGGYLIGFVPGAFLAGWLFEKLGSRTSLAAWIGGVSGIACIYLLGASWLAVWIGLTSAQPVSSFVRNAWLLGVVPFIGVDLMKAVLASALAHGIRRRQ